MENGAYELLALLMRYVFVLIGALVLFRAYRWMRRDARNYRREMRALPDAGLVGEIVDLRSGKSQPLPREGDMGASRECDIHVRGGGVLRHHVRFAFEEGKGLLITPARRGSTRMAGVPLQSPAYAYHGTQLQLGRATLRIRLFAGLNVPQPIAYQPEPLPDAFPGPEDAPPEEGFSAGPDVPAPFVFPDLAADEEMEEAAWQQPAGAPPPACLPPPGQAASAADYDGHYTEDGQMTWQYAYSMEELYQAQAALQGQEAPGDTEENDEALPYESPVSRRRRRRRS